MLKYEDIEYLKVGLPEDILNLKVNGNFKEALKLIDKRLSEDVPVELKKRLELEKYIIASLPNDYPYSFDEAVKILKEHIKDFKEEELLSLKDEGAVDWIFIDGQVKFIRSFYNNLLGTRPDVRERSIDQDEITETIKKNDKLLDDTIELLRKEGSLSYFAHLKTSLKIKDEFAQPGKTVRVHLPVPKECRQIKNIKIINTNPEEKFVAPADYPQRTVYFEKSLARDDEFSVEYSYENHVEYIDLDYDNVSNEQPDFYTGELLPHIMFTPYIRDLVNDVVDGETNPLKKARKIYDFITNKVRYSYVRRYLSITNIPEYAGVNLKGDCGIQALLFITMCRYAKIPARWQSGLYVTPYGASPHDWAQFYVEPYGWLFADPSFGGSALRRGNKERWNFYFGNIDPFRMVANSDFQKEFLPPKNFLRSDPYDNQIGECEYEDSPLWNDQFVSRTEVVEMAQNH